MAIEESALKNLVASLEQATLMAKQLPITTDPSQILQIYSSLHASHLHLSTFLAQSSPPPDEPMQVVNGEEEQNYSAIDQVEERMRDFFIQNKRAKRPLSPSAAVASEKQRSDDREKELVRSGEDFDPYRSSHTEVEVEVAISGEGNKHSCTDVDRLDWTPTIGMSFDDLDDAKLFWTNYGRQTGFSIRQQRFNRCKKDKMITNIVYCCSKEGVREKDKRRIDSKHLPEIRTNCKVMINLFLNRDNEKYTIKAFESEHNHELKPLETCFLKTNRKMSEAQKSGIEITQAAGLSNTKSHEFFGVEVGGKDRIGYILEDHKTYLRSKREKDMASGELGSILKYFNRQKLNNPSFYHSMLLDMNEEVTNIFWCDCWMQLDYEVFGDVVVLDITYRTNKSQRSLAVFTGFNHHRQMIVFGAAIMYDDTIPSFVWVLETFLEAHKYKKPQTIFTDQCQAMANAIFQVLPESFHGLCVWHLSQIAKKHMSNYMEGDNNFEGPFYQCMLQVQDEAKFEVIWNKMVEDCGVKDNSWINNIYALRQKWAMCFMKNTLTLGIRSTQLAESLNSDIKDRLRCDTDMENFFVQFDSVVSDKRLNEQASEFYARQKRPHESMNRSPLLRQVAKIYTPKVSLLFQKEFDKSLDAFKYHQGQYENQFVISSLDAISKEFKVYFDHSRDVVTCSCRLFEMEGILCHHILKVFSKEDVYEIPEKYILKRWSRGAKNWYSLDEDIKEGEDKNAFINRMNSMLLRALYHVSNSIDSWKEIETMVTDFCKIVFDSYPSDVIQQEEESTQGPSFKGVLKKKEGKRRTKF